MTQLQSRLQAACNEVNFQGRMLHTQPTASCLQQRPVVVTS
jgi:hypothetical protein